MLRCRSILFVPTAFLLMITWPALGQRSPDPDSPRYKAALALEAMLSSEGGQSLSDFVDHQVSPLMVNREGRGELLRRLAELRQRFTQMELRGARPEGTFSARLVFAGEGQSQALVFRVEEEPPHRFLEIGLGEGTGDRPGNGAGAQGEQGVQPEPFLDRQALANAVETRMEQAVSQGYSASVLVARGSEVLLEKGYGMANREKEIAITPETLFDVGSIGKVFTRVAIQKLREQGRLQLSDRLVRFFPEVPQDKAAITVSQLLDMRSGLHEYHDRSGDFEPMTREQALERIWKQPLRFQPGRGQGYSNSGYAVLAAIIEESSGLSYTAYLDRYLLEPAGLRQTGFYQLRQWEPDSIAVGYEGLTFGEVNSPAYWPEISWACLGGGCLVSSARELFRWFRGLAEGKILNSQSLQQVFPRSGDTQIYTGLNDFGFGAFIAFEPVREDLVVVLLNSAGEEGWSPIGLDLMKLLKRLR